MMKKLLVALIAAAFAAPVLAQAPKADDKSATATEKKADKATKAKKKAKGKAKKDAK